MTQRFVTYIRSYPRRSILVLLSIAVSIALIVLIGTRLNTGTVTIKTRVESNSISIQNNATKETVSEGTGRLKARLKPGQYTAFVNDKQTSTSKQFKIKARSASTYTLNLQNNIGTESVAPFGAKYIINDDSTVYYVDAVSYQLHKVDATGVPIVIDPSINFSNIKWFSASYGIGQSQDSKTLYSINNGVISTVTLPFDSSRLVYDLGPNGYLVISDGKSVYLQKPGNSFIKIYDDKDSSISGLSISGDNIFVRQKLDQSEDDTEDHGSSMMIDQSGRIIAKRNNLSIFNYKWSPNGKYLIVSGNTDSFILNNKLKVVHDLGRGGLIGLNWLNNQRLIYAIGHAVYSYDLDENNNIQIAKSETGTNIVDLSISSNKSQVYIAEDDDSGNYITERITLNDSVNIPSYYYGLSAFFPSHTDQCTFSFTNFIKPAIIITAWSDTTVCTNAAKQELEADSLYLDDFNLAFAALSDD